MKIFKHFSTYYNALTISDYHFYAGSFCGNYNPFDLDLSIPTAY